MSDSRDFVIRDGVLEKYAGEGGDVAIPAGVTGIGDSVFFNCGDLTGVTIPDSVTSIGNATFRGCLDLACVTIPDSMASIGRFAFFNCKRLRTVRFAGTLAEWLALDRSGWEDTPFRYGADLYIREELTREVVIRLVLAVLPNPRVSKRFDAFSGHITASITAVFGVGLSSIFGVFSCIFCRLFRGFASQKAWLRPSPIAVFGLLAGFN